VSGVDAGQDAGQAPVRTSLAWQRTALSLLVATMHLVRLTHGELGAAAWVIGGCSAALAAWVLLAARGVRRGDGAPAAAATACVVLLAATELLALLA
jgi:hypothetical protein